MPQGVNAQTVAYQYEKVIPRISELMQRDHTLWDFIEKRNVETVSSRAMRIPLDILAGGKPAQWNPDGGDAGRGAAIVADYAQISPVFFTNATEFTKLAEVATDAKEKAVDSTAKRNLEKAVDQIRKFFETLLNTDGSGTLDTVVSVAGNVLTVNNPNMFQDQQDIQIFSALGGVNRGTVTIQSVDNTANSKALYLTANAPGGTQAGDLLVVAGAPGVAATSLYGIEYHMVDSNTGTWLNLARSAYPGKLKTPHLNMNNFAITPAAIRTGISYIKRALGIDTPTIDDLVFHLDVDQDAAWENLGIIVSNVIMNQLGGTSSQDMLKKNTPETIAGRKKIVSIAAKPGRIDALCLKHWGRAEIQPVGPLEFGGQTMFPVYGGSGGVSGTTISYLWGGFNFFVDNPRAAAYWDNCAIPANY